MAERRIGGLGACGESGCASGSVLIESKIRQGITTEVTGEGQSVAPVSAETLRDQQPFLDEFKLTVDWTDLAGYFPRRILPPI